AGAILPLGAVNAPAPLPLGDGEPLRWHVRSAREDVDRLLDALFGTVVVVDGDWTRAVDLALAHPGTVIVTRDGDRFGVSGWRVGGPASGATGAALAEARERAADATERAAPADARRAEQEAGRQLDDHDTRVSGSTDSLTRVESERRDGETEIESLT